jgi:hypothetical protein
MHAIYTAFALVPWLWMALLALYALAQPPWMRAPLYLLLMMGVGSVPVWLAFSAWRRQAIPQTSERRLTLLAYLLGMALMVGTILADPLGLFAG